MVKRVLGKNTSLVIKFILFIAAIYNIYTLAFAVYDVYQHMIINLFYALPLTFIMYSGNKGGSDRVPWYDYLLALASFISVGYFLINFRTWFFERLWLVSPVTTEQLVVGLVFITLLFEAGRRVGAVFISIIAIALLAFLFAAPYLPAVGFRTSPQRVVEFLCLTPWGIFSTPLEVISTYVIAFTLLGAVFMSSGVSDFFIDIAKAAVGRSVGGPAKVSVIASSLFGTVSGSAVANVYTTGVFTIPSMKGVGFNPAVAGAVEAVASTGGQIMPPIMGAGAFIMAELLGIPYAYVMIAAVVPALLYYLGVYVQIHYYSVKSGLRGLTTSEIPKLREVLIKKGYCAVPLVVIIYLIAVMLWSPVTSALIALLITLVLSYVRRDTWMTPKKVFESFAKGIDEAVSIIVIAALAGMIAGAVTYSGLTLRFAYLINVASMGIPTLALIYTALITILLGMGMPTTAAYVLAASVAVPAVISMGVDSLAAHMFTFWYAVISAITPPVALAAYAAATLANDHPIRVAIWACKLGFSAFIIPFIIIYRTSILLGHGNPPLGEVGWNILIALIATYAIAVALTGHLRRELKIVERALLVAGGIALYVPGTIYDIAGLVAVITALAIHTLRGKTKVAVSNTDIKKGNT
ncbi:MAG: TRAP transporter fused permease subunit [Sulfolobales archaeon]|nr:TRAP transporter fused permease subunit [Sulfolobales archaeon]